MKNQIEQQQNIAKEMMEVLNTESPKKQIWNIPTGYGKTYIFLELAKALKKSKNSLKNKKIIITTSSNQLVRKYHEIAQEKNIPGVIEISKSNYIDPDKYMAYLKDGTLPELIEDKSLKPFTDRIESDEKNIFISDFIQNVNFLKDDVESFIKNILKQDGINKEPFSQQLTFTNHYFLLHMLKHGKEKFNLDDYIILMDEIHTIGDVAETVFSNQFSIYAMRMYIHNIYKNIKKYKNFQGKLALIKNITSFSKKLNNIIYEYSSPKDTLSLYNRNDLYNEHSVTRDQYIAVLDNIQKDENLKHIVKKLSLKKEYSQQLSRDIQKIKEELESINQITSKKNDKKSILSYTPVKGYPLISVYQQDPLYFLHKNLWTRSKYFIGSSATVLPYDVVYQKENQYFLKRLGIGKDVDHGDIINFNKTITNNYYLKYMGRIFKKENVQIIIKEKSEYNYESVYDEDFDENSKYYDDIIEYIHRNHDNKKSIIFCGGYKAAEYLAKKYMKIYDDVPVHYASPKKSSVHVLKDFEKIDYKKGGLLFATRDYGVGVSLEGKKLENIFLLRFPYPIISSPKWISMREKGIGPFMGVITKEMLITLMQFLGRLQRSNSDTGKIFIMDDRYHSNQKKLFDEILTQYGVFEKIENKVVKRKSIDDALEEYGDLF